MRPTSVPKIDSAFLAVVTPYLKKLREDTDTACETAIAERVDDAYNRGDLRCVEASMVVDESGYIRFQVDVEEAAPDAYKLIEHIGDLLYSFGHRNVSVATEW